MNQEYTVDPSRLVSPDACSADAEEVSLRPKTCSRFVEELRGGTMAKAKSSGEKRQWNKK